MSMKCPFCRAEIPDDSWFCDQCGKELHFCPDCHKPARGTECPACGADLVSAEEYFKAKPAAEKALFLVGDGLRLPLREGVFGRDGGIYPELAAMQYVSRKHGELRHLSGKWQIRDFGSTNGTFVDGHRLPKDEWHDIAAGSSVKIATSKFTIEQ